MTIQEKLQIIADALGTETTNVQPGVLLEDIEELDSWVSLALFPCSIKCSAST